MKQESAGKKAFMAGVGAAMIALLGGALPISSAVAQTGLAIIDDAPDSAWRTPDPENVLLMDLPSGRVTIELAPDLSPHHVERIKTLTRAGFYDGLIFHRVIEGFMAQGGDPTGTGTGNSELPDLEGEFYQQATSLADKVTFLGRDSKAARVGFMGSLPISAQPETLSGFLLADRVGAWGSHCAGVMSMARSGAPNSANSQFFLMFGDARDNLDATYTVWGRIIDGEKNARRIARGEPPTRPTPIVRARIAADVPADEWDVVEVMRTDSPEFLGYLQATNNITEDGYVDDLCGIRVPKRINGETKF